MDRDLNLRPLFAAPRKTAQGLQDNLSDDLFHFGVLVTLLCMGVLTVKMYWGDQ